MVVTSLLSFWITEYRLYRQAESAFGDKARQITGMAGSTRILCSQNMDKMVPNHECKYRM